MATEPHEINGSSLAVYADECGENAIGYLTMAERYLAATEKAGTPRGFPSDGR
jgi:hypothetical protein